MAGALDLLLLINGQVVQASVPCVPCMADAPARACHAACLLCDVRSVPIDLNVSANELN